MNCSSGGCEGSSRGRASIESSFFRSIRGFCCCCCCCKGVSALRELTAITCSYIRRESSSTSRLSTERRRPGRPWPNGGRAAPGGPRPRVTQIFSAVVAARLFWPVCGPPPSSQSPLHYVGRRGGAVLEGDGHVPDAERDEARSVVTARIVCVCVCARACCIYCSGSCFCISIIILR